MGPVSSHREHPHLCGLDDATLFMGLGIAWHWNTYPFVCFCFLAGSLYRALAVLEFTLLIRLALNSEISLPLPPSALIKSVHQHARLLFFKMQYSI